MRMFLLALVALFAAGEPALAQTASWRVSEASGEVRIIEGGRSRPATRGALLSGGSVVATAQRARAVLVRGRDYVIVSPASRVRVPTAEQGGSRGLVQIMTDAGTAMFRIEHRARPHFAVQTPYLAAVVKGTVFTVTVNEAGASVQVTEGAVEVSTADGGAAELVRPGMIATVSAADLQQLNIQGETSRSIRSNGAPAAGVVTVPPSEAGNYQGPADSQVVAVASVTEEPVALAETTGGLVEGNAGVDLALADLRDAVRPDAGSNGEAGNSGHSTSGSGTAAGDNGEATATPGNGGDAGGSGNAGDGDNSGSGATNGGGDEADDDGNNGHGNDDDGDDAGNPGHGGGDGNGSHGNDDDDGNNGHGNDDDGDDASNPGNGGGNGNGGPGNNNGHGNDDDGNNGHGNNGHGHDDDGNNGHGNDDDGNHGNGGPGNGNGGGNGDDGDDGDDD